MLNAIKTLLAELTGGDKHQNHFQEDDYRLAAAALMVHVATLEGDLPQAARDKLHDVLKTRFELDDALTDQLIDAALSADHEAVDFYRFTSLLMRALNEAGRLRVIEMMWQVVFADGRASEFEENVMWRVADLLGVSARQRIELRDEVSGVASSEESEYERHVRE